MDAILSNPWVDRVQENPLASQSAQTMEYLDGPRPILMASTVRMRTRLQRPRLPNHTSQTALSDHSTKMTPSEQTSLLGDLPTELVCKIVSKLEPSGCTEFALTNSHCSELARGQILSKYSYSSNKDLGSSELRNFFDALQADGGGRAWRLKDLQLRNEWFDKLDEYTDRSESARDRMIDELGTWLMRNCIGLRRLHVAYHQGLNFFRTIPPKLQELAVRSRGYAETEFRRNLIEEIEYVGELQISFLPTALRSTSLTTLDIGAETIVNDDLLAEDLNVPVSESNLEHLLMKVGNFNDKATVKLLRAPRNLRSFHFSPINRVDLTQSDALIGSPWTDQERTQNLPTMSVIGEALQPHQNCLEELTILRGHSHWHPKMDRIGTLADFRSLKYLNISIGTLLGYNHCQHHHSPSYGLPTRPENISNLLPSNLETLELFHDEHHHDRNGASFFLSIIESLIKASSRFQRLRRVILSAAQPYCQACDLLSDNKYPARWSTKPHVFFDHMRIEEAKKIRDALYEAKVSFQFFSRYDGLYRRPDKPGYTRHEYVFKSSISNVEEMEGWDAWDVRYPRLARIPATWRMPDRVDHLFRYY